MANKNIRGSELKPKDTHFTKICVEGKWEKSDI